MSVIPSVEISSTARGIYALNVVFHASFADFLRVNGFIDTLALKIWEAHRAIDEVRRWMPAPPNPKVFEETSQKIHKSAEKYLNQCNTDDRVSERLYDVHTENSPAQDYWKTYVAFHASPSVINPEVHPFIRWYDFDRKGIVLYFFQRDKCWIPWGKVSKLIAVINSGGCS